MYLVSSEVLEYKLRHFEYFHVILLSASTALHLRGKYLKLHYIYQKITFHSEINNNNSWKEKPSWLAHFCVSSLRLTGDQMIGNRTLSLLDFHEVTTPCLWPTGGAAARLGGGTSCGLQYLPGQRHRPWCAQTDPLVQGPLSWTGLELAVNWIKVGSWEGSELYWTVLDQASGETRGAQIPGLDGVLDCAAAALRSEDEVLHQFSVTRFKLVIYWMRLNQKTLMCKQQSTMSTGNHFSITT